MSETIKIPDHFRRAKIDDFHTMHGRHIGMKYWLYSYHNPELQKYTLNQSTNSKRLIEWIDAGRVYIEVSRYEGVEVIKLKQ